MKDINLLQGLISVRKQFDLRKSIRVSVAIFIIIVIVMAAAAVGLSVLNGIYQGKTADMKAQMNAYSEVNTVKNDISAKTKQISDLKDLVDKAQASGTVKSDFFNTVSSALNDSVFLTNIAVNNDGSVSMSGKSSSRMPITYFIYALKESGHFSNVSFNVVNSEKQDNGGVVAYDFTATAVLKGDKNVG